MSQRRSRAARVARRSMQTLNERVTEISSDEEEHAREQPLVRDGTSALPDGGFSALPEEQQDELEKRLIRYMICRNAKKRPVSRPDLTRYVFANMNNIRSKGKVFKGTMAKAQNTLKAVFGMEIIQIQKQIKMRSSQTQRTATATRETATQSSGPDGQKGYILVSTLQANLRGEDKKNKALIGFLTVVGGLILLEPSCRIEQDTLYRALERIGVLVRDKRGHKQINNGNVKDLLESTLVQQWYLEREREDQTYFYTLGPRFRAEIEDEDLIDFVNAVYKGNDEKPWLDETSRRELQLRLDDAIGKAREDPDGEEMEED